MYDHGQKKYIRDDIGGQRKSGGVDSRERRVSDRHIFTASAEVVEVGSGVRISTRTTDLSCGGCFCDTINPFRVGTKVRVTVHRDQTRVDVLGAVVYAQVGLGMGIAFEPLGAEQQTSLEEWIAQPVGATMQHAPVERPKPAPSLSNTRGSERAILARLVQLLISKGVLSEEEGTSIFNDSILL